MSSRRTDDSGWPSPIAPTLPLVINLFGLCKEPVTIFNRKVEQANDFADSFAI